MSKNHGSGYRYYYRVMQNFTKIVQLGQLLTEKEYAKLCLADQESVSNENEPAQPQRFYVLKVRVMPRDVHNEYGYRSSWEYSVVTREISDEKLDELLEWPRGLCSRDYSDIEAEKNYRTEIIDMEQV